MVDNSQNINPDASGFKAAVNKTFISLRNRNYKLFFIGQTISNVGNWITSVALTLLVLNITHSGFAVGLVAAFQFGPILFLSAWAGAIADRSDKRKAILITQCLEMAQSIGLAILAFMPHPPLFGLYALALVGGIVLSFDNPLRRSFVSEMVREEDIPNAVVLYSTIVNLSRVFGPALAGLLVVTLGFGWGFTIDAATYLVVLYCVFIMRPEELYRQPIKAKAKGEVREGLRYILSMPTLWISFVMVALIGTLSYNFNVTLPLFVTSALHSTAGVFTILYSIYAFGSLVSTIIVARRGAVQIRHVVYGAAALGFAMILLGSVPGVKTAAPVVFLVGASSILFMTAATTIVQTETRREMQGRLLALQSVLTIGTGIIGGPFCGWLADSFGARTPIIFGGLVALIAAVFGYFASRRYMNKSKMVVD